MLQLFFYSSNMLNFRVDLVTTDESTKHYNTQIKLRQRSKPRIKLYTSIYKYINPQAIQVGEKVKFPSDKSLKGRLESGYKLQGQFLYRFHPFRPTFTDFLLNPHPLNTSFHPE